MKWLNKLVFWLKKIVDFLIRLVLNLIDWVKKKSALAWRNLLNLYSRFVRFSKLLFNWFKSNAFVHALSVFLILAAYLIKDVSEFKLWGVNWFAYLSLYSGILIFSYTFPKNTFFNFVHLIIAIPYLFLQLFTPFINLFLALIVGFVLPIGTIFLFIEYVPEILLNIDLYFATKLYLSLTLSSIVVVTFGEKLMKYLISVQENGRVINRKEKRIEFTLSLVNNGIVKYLIFLLYFFLLLVFSISKFNGITIFEGENINSAILQSFVTFIAFDRLITNKKLMMIVPQKVKENLIALWKTNT